MRIGGSTSRIVEVIGSPLLRQRKRDPGASGPFNLAREISGCQVGHALVSVSTAHTVSSGAATTIVSRLTTGASSLICMRRSSTALAAWSAERDFTLNRLDQFKTTSHVLFQAEDVFRRCLRARRSFDRLC